MKKLMMIGALAGALALVVPGVAHAQYGGDTDEVSCDDATPEPGEDITCQMGPGTWEGGATVEVTLFSEPIQLATLTAADDGSLNANVEIPSDVEPGQHTLQFAGTGPDGNAKTLTFTVNVGGAAAPGEQLAATGSSGIGDMLRTSGLVTVVGLTLVALAISRQRARAERATAQETAGV